ncbi:MAG TPA: hypothetical protein VF077_09740 [Nitrospiraceae bacterium]
MKKKKLLKVLKVAEEIGDTIAQQHEGHDCPIEEAGISIREGCREVTRDLAGGNGPPQVATDTYRRNWESIFGAKQSWGQA